MDFFRTEGIACRGGTKWNFPDIVLLIIIKGIAPAVIGEHRKAQSPRFPPA
jgi:hypothetical protein